jgi:hypothetical protein
MDRLTGTKKIIAALALPLFCLSSIYAGDGFEAVRCGGDIPKALIGRKGDDEPVVKIEERHKDLGLKDLGAEIVSDDERLNLIFWQICGEEYVVLEEDNTVKDALKFPKHSKETPQFDGFCESNGKELKEVVLGVLKNEEGAAKLQALQAWKIDEKQKKFVPLSTEGLLCGRDGISTEDGGK